MPSLRGKQLTTMFCTCSFNKRLLSIYYVPGTVIGTEDTTGNKLDLVLALMELISQ